MQSKAMPCAWFLLPEPSIRLKLLRRQKRRHLLIVRLEGCVLAARNGLPVRRCGTRPPLPIGWGLPCAGCPSRHAIPAMAIKGFGLRGSIPNWHTPPGAGNAVFQVIFHGWISAPAGIRRNQQAPRWHAHFDSFLFGSERASVLFFSDGFRS